MMIGDLCGLHTGFTARGALTSASEGGVPVIQLRDVGFDGEVFRDALLLYDLQGVSERYCVKGGEVLFRSRGDVNAAAVVSGDLQCSAIVIAPLIIMRPDPSKLLPAYLAWAINQPDAQRRLGGEAQGTNLRMIPKAALERLEICVPDLESQLTIVRVDTLARREADLLRDLAERRLQFHNLILSDHARLTSQQEYAQ